jgi:hypothetical protein
MLGFYDVISASSGRWSFAEKRMICWVVQV